MKAAIEAAQRRKKRTSELAAEARGAHERHDLYAASTGGPALSSPARLRELKQASDLADARLRLAWGAPDGTEGAVADEPEVEPKADDGGGLL
jgi:hypothetical protein